MPKATWMRLFLTHAALGGNLEVLKLLINKGLDINAMDKNGCTILMDAAIGGNVEALKLLIDKGLNVNAKDKNNRNCLDVRCRTRES